MQNKEIRLAYGEALVELGRAHPEVIVLDADVSSSTQTRLFSENYPERFFNVGIAEANMLGIAAGLAACGKTPFVNTFAVFASLRASDPLRSLIAYPNLNVKIGAAYSGVSDSYDGATHQSVEDVAVMRSIPNIQIIVPADAVQTRQAVFAAAELPGPVYLRLSRAAAPTIYGPDYRFQFGKADRLSEGTDLTIAASGLMVHLAREAIAVLKKQGISARLLNFSTLKPLDEPAILAAARDTGAILTVEEHSIYGGLGSAVAEVTGQKCPVPLAIMGFQDRFGETGAYEEVLQKMGLSAGKIAAQAEMLLAKKHYRSKEDQLAWN